MPHSYRLPVLLGILLTAPLCQLSAQAVPAAATWYVAAAGAYHRFAQPETVHTAGTASPFELHPVQVQLGHRFARGWGLEVDLMHAQRAAAATSTPVYAADGRSYYYYTNEAVQATAVSVLLCKPLQRPKPDSRWRFDCRVGLTYLQTRFTEKYYDILTANPGTTPPAREERRNWNDLPISAGLGASYRLGPHFDLTADASAHASWVLGIAKLFGTAGSPVGGGGGVGLRYSL